MFSLGAHALVRDSQTVEQGTHLPISAGFKTAALQRHVWDFFICEKISWNHGQQCPGSSFFAVLNNLKRDIHKSMRNHDKTGKIESERRS